MTPPTDRERPALSDADRELLENGRAAWKRFFYPANTDFLGDSYDLHPDVFMGLADNLRLALDALERLAGERGGEAVAWQVKDFSDGWITHGEERHARKMAENMGGALVRPLYAEEKAPDPSYQVDWSDLEDDISEAIADSIDIDWSSRYGAKAVVDFLKEFYTLELKK